MVWATGRDIQLGGKKVGRHGGLQGEEIKRAQVLVIV
jgi:hypothetical protein